MLSRRSQKANRRTLAALLCAVALVVPGAQMPLIIGAQAAPYATGDVLVSIGNDLHPGKLVKEFSKTGVLQQTLTTTGMVPAGSTFDANGNFYVTDFASSTVDKFDASGNSVGTFGSGYNQHPESILFDKSGNAYVGQANEPGGQPCTSCSVLKFDSAGNPLASFSPAAENRGTDWIELGADQCTLYYTSEGHKIKRFNLGGAACSNPTPGQLPDFATALPGLAAFALRQRPNGEVLVADYDRVLRLNSSGVAFQTYTHSPDGTFFALNLDPDNTSFWTADFSRGDVVHFDIATGHVIGSAFIADSSGAAGLSVRGEICVGCSAISLSPASATNPVGTNHTLTATVTKGGAPQAGKTVNFSVDTGPNAGTTGSGVTDSNGQATFMYTDTGGAGTDSISATFTDDAGVLNKATATKTWMSTSTSQYPLPQNDGSTWVEVDPTKLQVLRSPSADQYTLLSGNADMWTKVAGYNQDLGIFVSDNGAADTLLAWKESGGFAGTYSPNAAYVQDLYLMRAGHSYVFKLKWKANKNTPGSTLYIGAGAPPPPFSPTSLTAETFPPGTTLNSPGATLGFMVSNSQYTLSNSDGATWQAIDDPSLTTTLSPPANGTAVLGANADLWTSQATYNQDLGIFVSDTPPGGPAGPDMLVAWKESGGFAGTFSPNAAFVKAIYAMTGGDSYAFKLKWKTNKNAPGATIWAAAGNPPSNFSPTSLFAQYIPSGSNPYSAVQTTQYTLQNSDGATWQPMDSALDVTVSPAAYSNSIVGANADLWTANAGYNQDLGIFVSDTPPGGPAGPDTLLTWKESGGFAGTYSPNAVFAQVVYPMTGGHTYIFKLKWKTNKSATGATIYAAAGPTGGSYSPTRLCVELIN